MQGIILAAGRGSRMGTLTMEFPKCLIKFRESPLIAWQTNALHEAGIKDIAVVTGYKRSLISSWGDTEIHNPDWETSNMLYSLTCAMDLLTSHTCIISYSDIIFSGTALRPLIKSQNSITISYDEDWERLWSSRFKNIYEDAEQLIITNGKVSKIGSKLTSNSPNDGQYMGLLKTTPQFWLWFLEQKFDRDFLKSIDMTTFLSYIITASEYPVAAERFTGHWFELDSRSDIDAADKFLPSTFCTNIQKL